MYDTRAYTFSYNWFHGDPKLAELAGLRADDNVDQIIYELRGSDCFNDHTGFKL